MKRLCLIAATVLLCLLPCRARAQELDDARSAQQRVNETIAGVVSGLDFSQLEEMEIPGLSRRMSVKEAVLALASGETVSAEEMLAGVLGAFADALAGLGALMITLMLPVLLSSILMHTIGAQKDALSSLSRSVCFMLILIPVMLLVFSELEHTRETITAMTGRMDKLLPLLLTLLTALGGSCLLYTSPSPRD